MKQRIITMDVDVTQLASALEKTENLAKLKIGAYVCVSNVHMCMETFDSPAFEQVVNNADLVIADGRPISWAQKLLGHELAQQVRGQDIMTALCERSNVTELKIGFYGGNSEEVLTRVITNLKIQFKDIKIVYSYSPPFRPLSDEEDNDVVHDINANGVDVLFVGIGCPKQEIWMAEHKKSLSCVMLGVGAAFDFIAGDKKHAPRWMQKIGCEWVFRLFSEPKRLWKRYLKQNPRFIFYFLKQLILPKA
jgi:N-acetylglucosaminyldiphosphoundecaprenol N-acetyl-beta-D-mannosaminyltransferase